MLTWIVGATVVLAMAATIVFLLKKAKTVSKEAAGEFVGAGNTALDLLLRDAEQRLAASKLLPDARFGNLPVFFITGPESSMKTTAVVRSGLEPELLAGQVLENGAIVPTTLVNVWYAQKTVFVEAGPRVQADSAMWMRLIKRMQPGQLRSALRKDESAPRAAVVCFECENLLKPGAVEAAAEAARQMRARLTAISSTLGVNLPVYVLFTKVDRIAYFHDYVRNFNDVEAGQVLGATLPLAPSDAGLYGQKQADRVGQAFQDLVFSLAGRRPEFLARENDGNALGAVYEFPREFRKLRGPLIQFLVELCRPSELTVNPFLRGFYFCGVRPIVIQEEVAAEPASRTPAQAGSSPLNPDATRMFQPGEQIAPVGQGSAPPARRINTRKVPQWVFLNQLFNGVLLQDRAGLSTSGASVKTSALRRVLLASTAMLCLLLAAACTISYLQNRDLENQVREAAAPSASLQELEALRQALVRLIAYERQGAPVGMRWGLYTGAELYPEARRLYFARFRTLLFNDTQGALLSTMKKQPPDYGTTYNTLKAYLETTSNHDKARLDFLPPVLQDAWLSTRAVDPERAKLARLQFDFYTSQLVTENPYESANDAATVESTRKYLAQFAGAARVYQAMLAGANRANPSFNFNQKFPGSAQVVENTREMQGAFSKPGFAFMETAIKNPNQYASGEQWVLGDYAGAIADRSKLQDEIRGLYYQDFINQWRDYLKKSAVVRYRDLTDAANKLKSSPTVLMELFGLAAQNTAVDAADVVKAFRPLQALTPAAMVEQNQYKGPANTNYMDSLAALQNALEQSDPQAIADKENAALLAARQTESGLGVDPDAHIEKTMGDLLEAPIPKPKPFETAAVCAPVRALLAKKPFQPKANVSATLAEVNNTFQPQQGALWRFYEQNLKSALVKQGDRYAVAPGVKPAPSEQFVTFFNNAARFSKALYGDAGSEPKLSFDLKPAFVAEIRTVQLTINGHTETLVQGGPAKRFTWPGPSAGVRMSANGIDYPAYDGLWAVFEFFYDADRAVPSPEWVLRAGRSGKPVVFPGTNQPVTVHFDLDMLGNPEIFGKAFFSSLTCPSS